MVVIIKGNIWIKAIVVLIIGILLNEADTFIFEKLKKAYDNLEFNRYIYLEYYDCKNQ